MRDPRATTSSFPLPACPASSALLVGTLAPAEQAVLAQQAPHTRLWHKAANLSEARRVLAAGHIERVLLAQYRPGQLPADAPQRIREAAPAVQLLSVAGDWCEGELRSGSPWEGVARVYWRQLLLPHDPLEETGPPQAVLVCAADYDSGSAWVDALSELGFCGVWERRGRSHAVMSPPRLAIWDGGQLDGAESDELAAFCRGRRSAAVVAVFDYPRADVVATAHRVGASAVLGRPWTLEQLETALAAASHARQRGGGLLSAAGTAPAAAERRAA